MTEPLLRIRNHHVADSGDPPMIGDDDPDIYIGYFENPFGEQWVFTFHRTTRRAELRGGDIGWSNVHPVVDGRVDGMNLGRDEFAWLQACWLAQRPAADRFDFFWMPHGYVDDPACRDIEPR